MLVVEKAAAAAALAELKGHLRLEDSAEDALLAGWLRAATEAVELELGQLLIERRVEEVAVLGCGAVRPTLMPVQALESVEVRAADGGWNAIAAESAILKRAPVRVLLPGMVDGCEVRVRYRAGFGPSWNQLPEMLRQAVVRLAAHFHAHRDSESAAAMPPAVRQLLAPLRTRRLL